MLVRFTQNFGEHEALSAGTERSSGEIIIFIDVDGQNAPQQIPCFIAEICEGCDTGAVVGPARAGSALA